jgi:hypothetical protein
MCRKQREREREREKGREGEREILGLVEGRRVSLI